MADEDAFVLAPQRTNNIGGYVKKPWKMVPKEYGNNEQSKTIKNELNTHGFTHTVKHNKQLQQKLQSHLYKMRNERKSSVSGVSSNLGLPVITEQNLQTMK